MQDEKYQGYLGVTLLALILLVLYFFRYAPDSSIEDTDNVSSIAVSEDKSAGDRDLSLISHRLSINSATVRELVALPGIGETLARRIVEKRAEKHGFTSIDELSEVKGIGVRKLQEIRKHVTIR
jgi:competence protein ComEA